MSLPSRHLAVAVALLLAVATACSDDDSATPAPDLPADDMAAVDDAADAAEDDAASAPPATGGSATLVIGDDTWRFESVMCAFGEDEIGIEGATWNMAARDGSLSLYAAIDADDDVYIELGDLGDDEAPNLMTVGAVEIVLDGTSASGSGTFVDINGDTGVELPGTLEAVCP